MYLKLILQLCFYLVIFLPLQFLGAVILAVYLPFSKSNQLPTILRWFDNADQYVERDNSTYLSVINAGLFDRYVWLAWRNSLNYFSYKILGFVIKSPTLILQEGNPNVGDSTGRQHGAYKIIISNQGHQYYQYYLVLKYTLFNYPLCLRIMIGHEIGPWDQIVEDQYVVWVCSIVPIRSYSGI